MYSNLRPHQAVSRLVVLSLITLCLSISSSSGQPKIVFYRPTDKQILYSIHAEVALIKSGFYYPEYELEDTVITTGVNTSLNKLVVPDQLRAHIGEGTFYGWDKKFNEPLKLHPGATVLFQRSYTENVKHYTVCFLSAKLGSWFTKKFEIFHQGYQIPLTETVTEWKQLLSGIGKIEALEGIERIMIIVEPASSNQKCVLSFGSFVIKDVDNTEVRAAHPFFDIVFDKSGESESVLNKNLFWHHSGVPIVLSTEKQYNSQFSSGQFSVLPSSPGLCEIDFMKTLLRTAISRYPFYREKGLDKLEIEKNAERIFSKFSSDSSLNSFSSAISDFIDETFHDPHFYVRSPNLPKKIDGPVRIYQLNGAIYISAVFNKKYESLLGSRVLDIDNQNVEELVKRIQDKEKGAPTTRRRFAINKLLQRISGDSVTVRVISKDNITQVKTIYYNEKNQIPAGFKIYKPFEFRKEDNVSYFRLSSWDLEGYTMLLNNWNDITHSDGLVLDLRNNGGGEQASAYRIFSLFIDKPSIYTNYYSFSSDEEKETLVLGPNNKFNFPKNKPLFILVDELTGCTSEQFIMAMKANTNAKIIGANPTAGALSSTYRFEFPSGITVNINSLSNRNYFRQQDRIEDKGIEPDIWVRP